MEITRVEAGEVLRPYLQRFRRCVVGAWEDYDKFYQMVKHIHSITCRANIIHSHMINHARREFEGVEGARPFEIDGLFLVSIQNRIVVRFKKLDDEMRSRNFPTNRQLDYLAQYDLPGIPPATRLEVGYQLNSLQTGIRSVLITCPRGKKVDWYIELEEETVNNVIEIKPQSQNPPKRFKFRVEEKKEVMTDEPGS